jgi:hypothetical protein
LANLTALVVNSLFQQHKDRLGHARARQEAWAAAVDPLERLPVADCGSVSGLLRAEYAVVPFSPLRTAALRELRAWGLRARAAAFGQVTGGGGVGKTRLVRELAYLLADEEGWRCGLVRPGCEVAAVKAAMALGVPVLVVIDNDTPHLRLAEALGELGRHRVGAGIRVLLVARDDDAWRQQLHGHSNETVRGLVRDAVGIRLGPLVTDPEAQRQIFQRALRAYARARGTTEPHGELRTSDPSSPVLVLHAAALVAVLRAERGLRRPAVSAAGEVDLATELLEYEADHWAVAWSNRRFAPLPPTTQRQAVGVATLLGAAPPNLPNTQCSGGFPPSPTPQRSVWNRSVSGCMTSIPLPTGLAGAPSNQTCWPTRWSPSYWSAIRTWPRLC